ncbi:U3 small nucleolar RNA-associated protein 11 [Paragonimus heterotremus]|uniref:U3 small nucleolar RNA-associated protein 11 n=1 Tax=Paragonimus heterotremus TaxID=100268 RepID=A0A8J4SRZ1_9TREM|nr:U3 small nucleolar RNA-associated protein 11 [Paragonimus heterotremus]
MPFASFKNVQKRYSRTHKERSQPESRRHLGHLPKKKDFILRARDKEKKAQKLKEYRRLALTKNDDEFYFNMHNSMFDAERGHIPLDAGVKYSDSSMKSALSMSVLQLRFELQKELAKIRRLESSTNLIHGDPNLYRGHTAPKHVFFAESTSEAVKIRSSIRSGAYILPPSDTSVLDAQLEAYSELEQRLKRAEALKLMLKKREAKQTLLKNSKKKYRVVAKETDTSAPIFQFETVRAH